MAVLKHILVIHAITQWLYQIRLMASSICCLLQNILQVDSNSRQAVAVVAISRIDDQLHYHNQHSESNP